MPKGDQAVNREGPRIKLGGRKPRNLYAIFGTEEEIEARGRDIDLAGPDGFNPSTTPASFRQTAPEVSRGISVNRAPLQRRSQSSRYNEDKGGPGRP